MIMNEIEARLPFSLDRVGIRAHYSMGQSARADDGQRRRLSRVL